jgi:hypothetical protein
MVIKDDVWLKILPCLNSYRCLSRMINHIELDIRTHAIYSDRALNSAAMT